MVVVVAGSSAGGLLLVVVSLVGCTAEPPDVVVELVLAVVVVDATGCGDALDDVGDAVGSLVAVDVSAAGSTYRTCIVPPSLPVLARWWATSPLPVTAPTAAATATMRPLNFMPLLPCIATLPSTYFDTGT